MATPTPIPAANLIEEIYANLRALAAHRLRDLPPGQTLQPTALVHEVYLRLARTRHFNGPSHFFSAAAQAMRHFLIDAARKRSSLKHGAAPASLASVPEAPAATLIGDSEQLLALDAAMRLLELQDPHCGRIVMLRCFAGLTNIQVAQALDITPDHAERSWRFARAFLRRHMPARHADNTSPETGAGMGS